MRGSGRCALSWSPLSVDGLLLLATAGLLKPRADTTRRARGTVRSAFLLGIVVSLAANIAAAPALEWQPVLVAPLFSVELLVHGSERAGSEAEVEYGEDDAGSLLGQARILDVRHREVHQRPISAETLRKELRIGAGSSRQLVALVRDV